MEAVGAANAAASETLCRSRLKAADCWLRCCWKRCRTSSVGLASAGTAMAASKVPVMAEASRLRGRERYGD